MNTRVTLTLPAELWEDTKALASLRNCSCGELIRQHIASIPAELAKAQKAKSAENFGLSEPTEFERLKILLDRHGKSVDAVVRNLIAHLESMGS